MLWFEAQNSAPWKPWVKSNPTDEQFTVSVSKKALRLSLGSFLFFHQGARPGPAWRRGDVRAWRIAAFNRRLKKNPLSPRVFDPMFFLSWFYKPSFGTLVDVRASQKSKVKRMKNLLPCLPCTCSALQSRGTSSWSSVFPPDLPPYLSTCPPYPVRNPSLDFINRKIIPIFISLNLFLVRIHFIDSLRDRLDAFVSIFQKNWSFLIQLINKFIQYLMYVFNIYLDSSSSTWIYT